MKIYLITILLAFTLTVSVSAQTAGDNNPKSPNRHHTRPPYLGPSKHDKQAHHATVHKAGLHQTHQPKPKSDHIVAR